MGCDIRETEPEIPAGTDARREASHVSRAHLQPTQGPFAEPKNLWAHAMSSNMGTNCY
jgi:hypothetical protein